MNINKEWKIDLVPFIIIAIAICTTILMTCIVRESNKLDIEKEKTKQLQLELQLKEK